MLERALRDIAPVVNEWYRRVLFLPPQASAMARRIDALHYVEITFYTLVAVAFMGATVWIIVRYRRRDEPGRTPNIQLTELVAAYAFCMLAVFVAFWYFSFRQYLDVEAASTESTPVYVTAKQWVWKFAYPEGVTSAGVLYLPAGRTTRLVLASRDVIHSFYVPDFRVKRDVVPGAYNALSLTPDRPGSYAIYCAELCGVGHSTMQARLVVLPPAAFARWLRENEDLARSSTAAPSAGPTDLVSLGRTFAAQHGCLNCHTTDGRRHVGPSWAGMYGHTDRLQDGTMVTVTPAYITESMMDPRKRVVDGFQPVMPSFQGEITPPETAAIVEFMRSLRDVPRVDAQVVPAQ
jgi:cytochrome c oxidase subunit 2